MVIRLQFIILFFIGTIYIVSGQSVKVVPKIEPKTGKLRAVVVGVSTYPKLPEKNQLDFAHKDAESVWEVLRSHPQADKDNIHLLKEGDATANAFRALATTTIGLSHAGDICVFYFAGHGDVQTSINEGFLLFSGIKTDTDYAIDDAFPLTDLNLLAKTAAARGTRFILITDACRSGKVVSEDGANQTLNVLALEWENVAKLVSCEASQRSFEYCDLGHGVFTFYLLRALKGYVNDKNDNHTLDLFELRGMIEAPILTRTGSQTPKLIGRSDFPILNVPLQGEKALEPIPPCKSESTVKLGNKTSHIKGMPRGKYDPAEGSWLTREFYESLQEPDKLVQMSESFKNSDLRIVDRKLIKTFSSSVQDFAKNSNKTLLAIGSSKDAVVKIYSQADFYTVPKDISVGGGISSLTFSNDSKKLLVARFHQLGVWGLTSGAQDTLFNAHNSKITALELAGDSLLISADESGLIKLWSYPEFVSLGQLKEHSGTITSLQLTDASGTLLSASLDGTIKVWDLQKRKSTKTLIRPGAKINDLAWDSFHKILYSAEAPGKIVKWEGLSWKKLEEYSTQTEMFDIDLNVDGRYLIAGGWLFRISIFETQKMQLVEELTLSRHGNHCVSFLDNQFIVAGNFAGELVRAKINLPMPYADALYAEISTNPFYKDLLYMYKSDYTATLLQESQKVIEPFLYGKDVLPRTSLVDRAILQLEKALVLNQPEPSSVKIIRCKLLFLKGLKIILENDANKLDSASAYFNQIITINPYATYPHNALSLVYSKKKELDKAKKSLKKASEMIPKWTEPKNNIGKNFIVEGKLQEASKAFSQIVELEPKASKGYIGLAELALIEGNLKESQELFGKAAEMESSPYNTCRLAYIDFTKGKFESCFSSLTNSIRLDSTYFLPHLYNSNFHLILFEDYNRDREYLIKAFEHGIDALRLNPFEPECYLNMAKIYSRLESLKETNYSELDYVAFLTQTKYQDYTQKKKEYLSKALKLSPSEAKTYYVSALLEKSVLPSVELFKNHKNKFTNEYEYHLYLGRLYLRVSDFTHAESEFLVAARLKSDFYEPVLGRIMAYRKSKNYFKLRELDKSMTERDRKNPFITLELALAYAETREGQKLALNYAEKILYQYPDLMQARFLKKSLQGLIRNIDRSKDDIQLPYSSIKPFSLGYNLVTFGENNYLTDNAGIIVMTIPFKPVLITGEGTIVVKNTDKFGVLNIAGDTLAAFEFDEIREQNGYLITRVGKLYGLLNPNGKKIIDPMYQALKLYNEFIAFQHAGKWGATSYRGSTIIFPKYSSINPQSYKKKPAIVGTLANGKHYYSLDGQCLKCD